MFNSARLYEILKAVDLERKEKQLKTEPWGTTTLRSQRGKRKSAKDTETEQPERWEENQEHMAF